MAEGEDDRPVGPPERAARRRPPAEVAGMLDAMARSTREWRPPRQHGLAPVDELDVAIHPVVLGRGTPLDRPGQTKRLRLTSIYQRPTGVVAMKFRRNDDEPAPRIPVCARAGRTNVGFRCITARATASYG